MLQEFTSEHRVDENGNPAGGTTDGVGLRVDWQDGPLGRGDEREEPNGAFVETLIAAAIDRLDHYETVKEGRFSCWYNKMAMGCLKLALLYLNQRTLSREVRGVEGTHEV